VPGLDQARQLRTRNATDILDPRSVAPHRQRHEQGCGDNGICGEWVGHGYFAWRASKSASNACRMISETEVCFLLAARFNHVDISSGRLTLTGLHFLPLALMVAFMGKKLANPAKSCQPRKQLFYLGLLNRYFSLFCLDKAAHFC
jgi:hypothetical protein